MSNKVTIYEALQTEVISDILTQSDMNFFRKVCRWYSTNFHTPLHIVMECREIQWDEVLTHYYEAQMEDLGYNQVYEIATKEYIPELAEEYEEENREFARALIKEQKETIKKAAAKKKQTQLKPEPSKTDDFTKRVKDKLKTEHILNNNKELPKPPPPMKLSFDDDEEV